MSFVYAINPTSKTPVFQINKHIGYDDDVFENGELKEKGRGQGVDGKIFSKEFFEIDEQNPDLITIYTNSMGGDVQEAFDMFNAVANASSRTKSVMQGFAYSSAGWVPLAADRKEATDYSSWMCHMPFITDGADEEGMPEFLKIMVNSIATIISQKSGRNGKEKLTVDKVKDMMRKKTYLTAQQLYDIGLIDKVIPTDGKTVINPNVEVKNQYKVHQKVLNQFIEDNILQSTTKTDTMYPKVLNRLGLTDNSSEADILEKIASLENKISASNQEKTELTTKLKASNDTQEELQAKLKKAQNEMDDAKNAMTAKCAEYDTLKNQYDAMNVQNKELTDYKTASLETIKNAENEAKSVAAKALVKQFVDCGKIKNEEKVIKVWEGMAIENYDQTQAQLEAIPTNASLPKASTAAQVKTASQDKVPGTFDWYRTQNREKHQALQAERERAQKAFSEAGKN